MALTITLLTDFGRGDEFSGVIEAVIVRIAPDARVIHLTHGIAPQDLLGGAAALKSSLPYCPVGVHLAVVDPGVGSHRRALVLLTGDGRLLVGPDNGLLAPAAEACGGVVKGWSITNPALMLPEVSRTFHGRDVFAPVAAHLARGLDPAEVGPAIVPTSLERLDFPEPVVDGGRVTATVMTIDRFGNVAIGIDAPTLDRLGMPAGSRLEITAGEGRYYAVRARTFAEVPEGDMVLFEDSSGWAALAVNRGSVLEVCGVARGDLITLEPKSASR